MLSFIGRLISCAIGTAVVYLVVSKLVSKEQAIPLTLVWSAPMWAIAFARFLVELLPFVKRKAERDAMEKWNGRYYAYGNRQLRLFLVDDVIWIAAADVAPLLDPPPDARELRVLAADYGDVPGQKHKGYTEAGLLRLLTTRTATRRATHDAIRFKLWLEKEAFPNLRRLPASAT